MTPRTARTIPIDKHAVRELAKELEQEVLDAVSHRADPLGKRVVSQRPHTLRAVDGSMLEVHVRLEAVPSRDFKFIVGGGIGTSTGRSLPIVVIFVNGSLEASALASGAKTHLVQLQIYPTLLHELTHAADKFSKGFGGKSEQDLRDNPAVYYNDPGEVRAFMQEVVDEASERFKHYEKLKKNFGSRALTTLLNMSKTWQEVSPHWTPRNQQKVMKTVYQALEDWQRAQRVVGRVVARECHADYVAAGVADCVDRYVDASAFLSWLHSGR